MLALFPSQVFLPTLLMTETPWTFLTMLLLALTLVLTLKPPAAWTGSCGDGRRDRANPRRIARIGVRWLPVVMLGLAFGAASLVRGEMLAFPLVLVAVWAVAFRSWRRAATFGVVTVAAMLVALAPWTLRNWKELGYPVLVSTGSADNLLAGHWSGADGLGSFVPGIQVNEEHKDLAAPAREIAVYKSEVRQALSFIVHNPRTELELIPKKLKHFYLRDTRPLDLIRLHPYALSQQNEDMFSRAGERDTITSRRRWRWSGCRSGFRCAIPGNCLSWRSSSTIHFCLASCSSARSDCTRRSSRCCRCLPPCPWSGRAKRRRGWFIECGRGPGRRREEESS